MKKKFEEPILEIIIFSNEDVMTTSTTNINDNWGVEDWDD